ncbi:hypothetical protein LINGRAHAP2_LOCUS36001 [Linum grandiflorum]
MTDSKGTEEKQEKQPKPVESCRKSKKDDATFLEDVKEHIDEFIHASMDEHKSCFKKTISKMFGMTSAVAKKQAEVEGVESVLPLKTTVTKIIGKGR